MKNLRRALIAETWKTSFGYRRYEISTHGRVRNTLMGRILTPEVNGGYLRVRLYDAEGKRCNLKVHRLMAQAYLPNPDNKPQVNHRDGVKLHNWVDNLEWSTPQENTQHSYDTGLQARLKHRKLNWAKVKAIREAHKAGGISQVELGILYGVSPRHIGRIINNLTWKIRRKLL